MHPKVRHALAALASAAAFVQQSADMAPTLHTIAGVVLVVLAAYGIKGTS